MHRFNSITTLAPLLSVLPFGAWLMLLASAVVRIAVPARIPLRQK